MVEAMEIQSGFKQTEVGVIPRDWHLSQMDKICDVRDGTHESPKYHANGVIFITSKNIVNGKIDFSEISYISAEDAVNIDKRSKVDNGDILMSMIGTIGNCVLVDFEPNFCIKNVALIKPQKIEGRFLVQLLFSQFYQYYIKSKLDGGIQKFISLGVLRSLDVRLPPTKAEQTAIATALNDADALVTQLEKLIAKKRAIKQGAMQELLKPKEGWDVKTLGEVAKYRRGSFPQPYGLAKWYDDNSGFPFVQVFDVDDNMKLKNETKRRISAEAQKFSVFVEKGSILLTIQGSIGRIAITQYDAYVDRTLLLFETFLVPINKYFFMITVFVLFEQEKQKAPGGTIKTITKEALSSFTISIPPIEKQTRIAQILSDMDAEIEVLEKKLKKHKMIKQGMMQNLLTGRIRLV